MMYLRLTTNIGEPVYKMLSEPKSSWIVGRHEECDIVVPRNLMQVSRQHLRLTLDNGVYYIEDLGSKLGTYLMKSTQGTFPQTEKLPPSTVVPMTGRIVLGDMTKDGFCQVELTAERVEANRMRQDSIVVIDAIKPHENLVNPLTISERHMVASAPKEDRKAIRVMVKQIIQEAIYFQDEKPSSEGNIEEEDVEKDIGNAEEEARLPEGMEGLKQLRLRILEELDWERGEVGKGHQGEALEGLLKRRLPSLFAEVRHRFNIDGATKIYLKSHKREVLRLFNSHHLYELAKDTLDENVTAWVMETVEEHLLDEIHLCLCDSINGYGPIASLIEDETIDEIMVNGPLRIFIEQNGILHQTGRRFESEASLVDVIQKIAERVNRHIDEASPRVDARLEDGSRVNAVIRPLAFEGASLTIRKFSKKKFTVEMLIEKGSMTRDMADFLIEAVRGRQNIIVSGGTGSGKTTLLNALCLHIPDSERLVVIEDSAELKIAHPNRVRLESRPANIEGKGQVTIRDLLVNALRMRPDRIIIGECRSGEALDMLQAMNTGHDGSLTTIHANSPRDTLSRLENMVLMAGFDLPVSAIQKQIASAVNLVVQVSRMSDGTRKITHITEIVGMEGDIISMQDIFVFRQGMMKGHRVEGKFTATGIIPDFIDELERRNQLTLKTSIFHPAEKLGEVTR